MRVVWEEGAGHLTPRKGRDAGRYQHGTGRCRCTTYFAIMRFWGCRFTVVRSASTCSLLFFPRGPRERRPQLSQQIRTRARGWAVGVSRGHHPETDRDPAPLKPKQKGPVVHSKNKFKLIYLACVWSCEHHTVRRQRQA